MKPKNLIYTGIAILVVSLIAGAAGTIWNIDHSFGELHTNESAGIGRVGSHIASAMIWAAFSLVGSVAGVIVAVVGIVKSRRR